MIHSRPNPTRATAPTGNTWPLRSVIASLVAIAALSSQAVAGDPPDVSMYWQVAGDGSTPINFNLSDAGVWSEQADGSHVFSGNLFADTWQLSWTTRVDTQTDVLLDTLLSVTNTSSTELSFSAATLLDSLNSTLDQSILTLASTLTVMNMQFSGSAVLSSTNSVPVISSLVDGSASGALFQPLYELTSAGPFSVATDSASLVTLVDGPDQSVTNASDFSLTAGDTATLHTITSFASIPAPGSFALIAMGALAGRRKRRRDTTLDRSSK